MLSAPGHNADVNAVCMCILFLGRDLVAFMTAWAYSVSSCRMLRLAFSLDLLEALDFVAEIAHPTFFPRV